MSKKTIDYSFQEAQKPLDRERFGKAFVKIKPVKQSKKAESKKSNIVRYTRAELAKMNSETDWARVDALTDEDIAKAVESDPDAQRITEKDWAHAVLMDGKEPLKHAISIRLDYDVLDFFKAQGRGYQTRINKVLRTYMEAQK